MKKAVSSNTIAETVSTEFISSIYAVVAKFRPLMRKLMSNFTDAEDLEQEVMTKIIICLTSQSNWWGQIENKEAYLVKIIRNTAFDLKRNRKFATFVSFDDDEYKTLSNKLSDGGNWAKGLNEKMELEKFRRLLKEAIGSFSDYEQTLIQLNFVEGLKPNQIAEMLGKDPVHVSVDCNRIKAALRGKLKKKIMSLK